MKRLIDCQTFKNFILGLLLILFILGPAACYPTQTGLQVDYSYSEPYYYYPDYPYYYYDHYYGPFYVYPRYYGYYRWRNYYYPGYSYRGYPYYFPSGPGHGGRMIR